MSIICERDHNQHKTQNTDHVRFRKIRFRFENKQQEHNQCGNVTKCRSSTTAFHQIRRNLSVHIEPSRPSKSWCCHFARIKCLFIYMNLSERWLERTITTNNMIINEPNRGFNNILLAINECLSRAAKHANAYRVRRPRSEKVQRKFRPKSSVYILDLERKRKVIKTIQANFQLRLLRFSFTDHATIY